MFPDAIVPSLNVWISFAGLVISAAALFSLVYVAKQVQLAANQIGLTENQIRLVERQLRQSNSWNKLQAQRAIDDRLDDAELETQICLELETKYDCGRLESLSRRTAEALFDDSPAFIRLKTHLNHFEDLCAAVGAGSIHDKLAFKISGSRVIYVYNRYRNLIEVARERYGIPTLYIELEHVARRWSETKEELRAQNLVDELPDL